MFSVSTVLGDKASEVEQPCGAGVQLPGRRPPSHWTGRRPLNEGIMFGQLSDLRFLFFFFAGGFRFFFFVLLFEPHFQADL